MKNKRATQFADRDRHKKSLKATRRSEPSLQRRKPTKIEKPTILIVCEGRNTEPSYFRQFKLSSATIIPIGEGFNTISLVNRTIILSQERQYDQVWCVFDKDDFSSNDFNDAIRIAEANNFGVAYSNQAFEYWLILHFDDHQAGGMNRSSYDKRINDLLMVYGLAYDGRKSKVITEEFFDLLDGIDEKTNLERKILAIKRAKRNYDLFDHISPANEESSTTVFKLVEELLKYV